MRASRRVVSSARRPSRFYTRQKTQAHYVKDQDAQAPAPAAKAPRARRGRAAGGIVFGAQSYEAPRASPPPAPEPAPEPEPEPEAPAPEDVYPEPAPAEHWPAPPPLRAEFAAVTAAPLPWPRAESEASFQSSLSAEPAGPRFRGVVAWYDAQKATGFLTPADGRGDAAGGVVCPRRASRERFA